MFLTSKNVVEISHYSDGLSRFLLIPIILSSLIIDSLIPKKVVPDLLLMELNGLGGTKKLELLFAS